MYFPYLRGKQYELLALRELSPLLGQQKKVVPIIEPVRPPEGSGLDRCFAALNADELDFILIANPSVGELRGPLTSPAVADYVQANDPNFNWTLGLLVSEGTDIGNLVSDYVERFGNARRLALIHKGRVENIDQLEKLTAPLNRDFDVLDDKLRRRYFRELLSHSRGVTLRDGFPSEDRNSAYLAKAETEFSDDHLFFDDEGWYGFSDYLTIGEGYAEGGFTPRAVAIHWTYEPAPGSPIMVRHFTSVSNGDTSNVGGKFLEAAQKLVDFLEERDIHTQASEVFRIHVANGTYPGLGIVKKLSAQNHLELVSGILSRS